MITIVIVMLAGGLLYVLLRPPAQPQTVQTSAEVSVASLPPAGLQELPKSLASE